jgi:hypothetical protein
VERIMAEILKLTTPPPKKKREAAGEKTAAASMVRGSLLLQLELMLVLIARC